MASPLPRARQKLEPVSFADLSGWSREDAAALVSGLTRHVDPQIRARPHEAPWLADIAPLLATPPQDPLAFVKTHFSPWRVLDEGFLTAYYEPVIAASRTAEGPFRTPLYRRPPDLVRVPPDPALPGDGTFAQQHPDGSIGPYPDRLVIQNGLLEGQGLEIAFVEDPVDAFFAQIQGSARLRFPNGETARISYHGKTGHPYTAIGRVMIDRGLLPEGGATMATIRAALKENPTLVGEILGANRSFVFFRERPSMGAEFGPIAAAGLPLIPWRSLAVDWSHNPLGTPIYVETTVPGRGAHSALMIAEDTGSAIVGPARGDIFMGSGDAAGAIAGDMKAAAQLTVILPKAVS